MAVVAGRPAAACSAALAADAAPTAVALLVPLAGLVPAGYLALVLQRRAAARAHEVPSEG